MSAQKKQQDYEKLAKSKRLKFIGPFPSSVREHTNWQCKQGHIFSSTFLNLAKKKKRHPCPECSDKSLPKSAKHYRKLAERKGISWKGVHVPNRTTDPTLWRCENGHTFSASYNQLDRKKHTTNGCKYCSRKAQKTDADYRDLAKKKGLEWLGPHPGSVHNPTKWKCVEGHKFESRFQVIRKAPGNGCARCSGMAKKTRADYEAVEKDGRMRWAGSELPKDTQHPTEWECLDCGHFWSATLHNITARRSGCPKCVDFVEGRRTSSQQCKLADILKGELNRKRCGYSVDVTFKRKGTQIVLEYDSWHFHGDRTKDDRIRDETLVQAGLKLLVIKSNSNLPTKKQLSAAIKELLTGKDRVEIRLSDWGKGDTLGKRKRKQSSTRRSKPKIPKGCVEIHANASECVAELDRRWLYIRRGQDDLHRFGISPCEAQILEFALAQNSVKVGMLNFTYESIHTALERTARNDPATRTLVGRLRNRMRFLEGESVGFLRCMSKGKWETTVKVRRRPKSRVSKAIQTKNGELRPFRESRAFVRKLSIKSQIEWPKWAKTSDRPRDIPTNPQREYREHGWKDWADWLGKPKRST